ncbi:MAG: glycosyltransferase family 39 protein [Candidatus Omnitrophica bacterium]|nr:glycosyltransferase family 39 protein [Candidatus Omnitrophota bacterium]
MKLKNSGLARVLILIGLSYIFFILGNSVMSLTNPDEVFYAGTAKEMIQHNSWATPYLFGVPQFEKPVLVYLVLRLFFMVFGCTSFVARLPVGIISMVGVLAVYFLGVLGFKDEKKGFVSGIILMSSGLFLGLTRIIFTDAPFSVFVLLAIAAFFWGYCDPKRKRAGILLFFAFSAISSLIKTPIGFLIALLAVVAFLIIERDIKYLFCKDTLFGIGIFAAVALPWYIYMVQKYGSDFTQEFFYNCHIRRILEAEHPENDSWYFYPATMIGGMFPWSIYVAFSLVYFVRRLVKERKPFYVLLACWIGATLLVFQPAHSKLYSYILPMFPALALIAADFLCDLAAFKIKWHPLILLSLGGAIIFLIFPAAAAVILIGFSKYLSSPLPVYFLLFASIALAAAFFICAAERKVLVSIYLFTGILLLVMCVIPFMKDDIEPYMSSKDSCACLMENYSGDSAILSSKPFVRGVKYYTGKKVAVIDYPAPNFFSPHPIPFLYNEEKVAEFLRSQPVTYCVLKEKNVRDIEYIANKNKDFTFTLLKQVKSQYVGKIERIKA